MNINDKVFVVTGASSGIGRALSEALLDKGAKVYATSRSVEQTSFVHTNLYKKNLDASKLDNVDWLIRDAIERFGRIDVFIANAGFAYYEILDEADANHIDSIFNLNTRSVIYSAVKMRELYKCKPFRFVAILSGASFVSMPGHALYSSTKAALRGFFDGYRHELFRKDQILHTVYPVATETEFFNVANQDRKPWPIQTVTTVSNAIIKGLEKDKERIHPSKLFKFTRIFMPWALKIYLWRERRIFQRKHVNGNNKQD